MLGLLACLLCLQGCIEQIGANYILQPPNGGRDAIAPQLERWLVADWQNVISVGPPDAKMVFSVIEPKQIQVRTAPKASGLLSEGSDPDGWHRIAWRSGEGLGAGWQNLIVFPDPKDPAYASRKRPVKGTIIVLLGFGNGWDQGLYMLPVAAFLADAGYRVILPDLRGHGDSTGRVLGYGVFESRDLSQLLDEFDRHGLLKGPVGVVGHSYGAGIAIQMAARDPRVAAVISMAPWDSMREYAYFTARSTARDEFPLLYPLLGWRLNRQTISRMVDRAGKIGGFDPDEADNVRAIARTHTPILILAADRDENCPVRMAQSLHAARPEGTELVVYDGEDHWSYLTRRFDDVRARCLAWFDAHLTEK